MGVMRMRYKMVDNDYYLCGIKLVTIYDLEKERVIAYTTEDKAKEIMTILEAFNNIGNIMKVGK